MATDAEPITIVLADDHAVVRSGLRMVLERAGGFEVVSEAGDADSALRTVLGHKPTVLVLDLNMPGELSSLDAIPRVQEVSPGTHVVILTMQEDPEFARRALRAGAAGYVLKEAADDELVDAVRRVAEGGTYLNPRLGALLAAAPPEPSGPPDDLTEREVEVLRLIALGHTNAEIAQELYLSVRTVESHRAHIQQKLGRSTRAELVRYALDHGFVKAELAAPLTGSRARTTVPACAPGATVRCPPASSTRSRMPARPKPVAVPSSASKPIPSSATRTSTSRPSQRTVSCTEAARACLTTLVSDSCTTRYTVVSTSEPRRRSSGSSTSASISTPLAAPVRCAREVRAGARPSWSRAGGRSSAMSRAQRLDVARQLLRRVAHRRAHGLWRRRAEPRSRA